MPRPLRFYPTELVEVTSRTIQGRFLLRPSSEVNRTIEGILAKAAARHDVQVVAYCFLSSHFHALCRPADGEAMRRFMNDLNGETAVKVGRLHGWHAKFWGRRFRAIPVSDESAAQVARLRYILGQGCNENLVRSPRDWPGVSSTAALLGDGTVRGEWCSWSAQYEARRRGEKVGRFDFPETFTFELAPLPCWDDLPRAEIRRRVVALIEEIEKQTLERLKRTGKSVLGPERVLRQDPHAAPNRPSRSPAPLFHAATRGAAIGLYLVYYAFRQWFQHAADQLRAGNKEAEFPPGCFPPGLPYCRGRPPTRRTAEAAG